MDECGFSVLELKNEKHYATRRRHRTHTENSHSLNINLLADGTGTEDGSPAYMRWANTHNTISLVSCLVERFAFSDGMCTNNLDVPTTVFAVNFFLSPSLAIPER